MGAPKFFLVGHTLGPWQRDSCVFVSLEWGCVYLSAFFLFLFYQSPSTIGFVLGVIMVLKTEPGIEPFF